MDSDDEQRHADVLVLGAGVAGLVAARALVASGADVLVVEALPQPGGRLATRSVGGAVVDSGAQFFTVRSRQFAEIVDEWMAAGCELRQWSEGFARVRALADGPTGAMEAVDGHPRYVVAGGMSQLPRRLVAGLRLRLGTRVRSVTRRGQGWSLQVEGAASLEAPAVVCTAPVPQALVLLSAGNVRLGALGSELRALRYDPCLSLLVSYDRPLRLPRPGGVQLSEGPVRWLGDNQSKSVSTTPALTAHADGEWSRCHLREPDERVIAELLGQLEPWTAPARPLEASLDRWLWSRPLGGYPQRCALVDGTSRPLVLAGDAFAEAKVEGAARSGAAAAAAVLAAVR